MKLLPKEPTPEMWEKAWNSIKDNEELERVRKVLSIHEIRMLPNHFCGAMYAAAPEVKEEQVFWQYRHNMNGLTGLWHNCCGVAEYEDRKQMPEYETRALYASPSPRIAELEAEVEKLRGAIRGASDAYQLLTNVANGIQSPADVQMAVSALRKIDEALK